MTTYQNGKHRTEERLARGLGWFSIGLGLMEFMLPRTVARLTGAPVRPRLLRALGLREIASGIGILKWRKPGNWLWSRVAGDVMDLTLLGAAMFSRDASRGRLLTATAAVAGVTSLDMRSSRRISEGHYGERHPIHMERTITINRPPEELYRFWHDFEKLPQFMNHLLSVKMLDEKHSHWVAKGPAGTNVEWDAEIINETPNQLIA
jgi:hypothetical protein